MRIAPASCAGSPRCRRGALEQLESLEQLRVLEAGYRIAVALAPEPFPPGVDTPEDLARAEARWRGRAARTATPRRRPARMRTHALPNPPHNRGIGPPAAAAGMALPLVPGFPSSLDWLNAPTPQRRGRAGLADGARLRQRRVGLVDAGAARPAGAVRALSAAACARSRCMCRASTTNATRAACSSALHRHGITLPVAHRCRLGRVAALRHPAWPTVVLIDGDGPRAGARWKAATTLRRTRTPRAGAMDGDAGVDDDAAAAAAPRARTRRCRCVSRSAWR